MIFAKFYAYPWPYPVVALLVVAAVAWLLLRGIAPPRDRPDPPNRKDRFTGRRRAALPAIISREHARGFWSGAINGKQCPFSLP
jgi:hypothetical protein